MARPLANILAEFDDSVAEAADWSALAGGGASFRSHRLVQTRPGRMVFKVARGAKGFAGIFLAVGVLVLTAMIRSIGREPWATVILLSFAGPAFMAMGALVLWKLGRPATFDLTLGVFWKGRRGPRRIGLHDSELHTPHCVNLDDVHALQIVSEEFESGSSQAGRSDGRKRTYRSYELDLVLTDASRVNVIDHGDHDRLLADARTLAKFLGVPLWDAG